MSMPRALTRGSAERTARQALADARSLSGEWARSTTAPGTPIAAHASATRPSPPYKLRNDLPRTGGWGIHQSGSSGRSSSGPARRSGGSLAPSC
eukprot:1168913-Alexandrium_andersonii.AAC.1